MLNLRLKELRKINKVTQKQVATSIGIAERHYQDLEYGKIKPSHDTMMTLADYFNVSLDYLAGRSDVPEIINTNLQSQSVLADRLEECRKAKNVTEDEVAEYLGIPVALYWKYESAILEPNIATLNKLAEYFKTSVDYLVGFEPSDGI